MCCLTMKSSLAHCTSQSALISQCITDTEGDLEFDVGSVPAPVIEEDTELIKLCRVPITSEVFLQVKRRTVSSASKLTGVSVFPH
jgi:hypothetical protein